MQRQENLPGSMLSDERQRGRKRKTSKLPAPVLPGSGAKGLSQPHRDVWSALKHPCFVEVIRP